MPLRRRLPVWLTAGAAFANGLFEVLRILVTRVPNSESINSYLPYGAYYWNRSLTLIFGFALIYLSIKLLQRKRMAWWLATVSSAVVLIVSALNEDFFSKEVISPLMMLALLVVFRKEFTVRFAPRSLARGALVVVLSVLVALAYGTLGFWLLDFRDFGTNFTAIDALVQTLREYTFTAGPDTPKTAEAAWFLDSLNAAGIFTAAFAAYSLFRPVAYRLRILPHERREARTILERHGTSSLDFFKLYPEKSYFFSRSRKSFIAYKTANNVAVALGDPAGPAEEIEVLIEAFLRYCSDNGWNVAFHEVLPDLLPTYRKLGLRVIKVGEEAVVSLGRFSSEKARSKKFRYTRRRYGEREGYRAQRCEPPHSRELLDEVEEISDAWLSMPGRRERGFSLGRFERGYIGDMPLFVVRDADGRVQAFANLIPSYRRGEATIDLMRYRPDMPNGIMDYLFIELMLDLAEKRYESFDLGLAPLAGVGSGPKSPLEERALDQISERLTRFFSYKGLRDYKAKFNPVWEDRFLVYRGGPPGLVATAVTLARLTEE